MLSHGIKLFIKSSYITCHATFPRDKFVRLSHVVPPCHVTSIEVEKRGDWTEQKVWNKSITNVHGGILLSQKKFDGSKFYNLFILLSWYSTWKKLKNGRIMLAQMPTHDIDHQCHVRAFFQALIDENPIQMSKIIFGIQSLYLSYAKLNNLVIYAH